MSALVLALLAIGLFITFLFSLLEKLHDRTGYQVWLKSHFKNSFVSSYIRPLFYVVLLMEVISVILLLVGVYQLLVANNSLGLYLAGVASVSCLFILLVGQRIAKDYQSAANLMVYLLFSILLIYGSEQY